MLCLEINALCPQHQILTLNYRKKTARGLLRPRSSPVRQKLYSSAILNVFPVLKQKDP